MTESNVARHKASMLLGLVWDGVVFPDAEDALAVLWYLWCIDELMLQLHDFCDAYMVG